MIVGACHANVVFIMKISIALILKIRKTIHLKIFEYGKNHRRNETAGGHDGR